MLNSGTLGILIINEPQVKIFQYFDLIIKINRFYAGEYIIRFGIGNNKFLRIVNISIPIGNIIFYVIPVIILFLFYLEDMRKKNININILRNILIQNKKEIFLIKKFGYLFIIFYNNINKSLNCFFIK
jgi:hypothetical protein